MTAKRFIYNVNKNCIECDGKFIAYVDSVDGFRIANKLTTLAEENEQLKESVYSWSKSYNRVYEENEQLKQQIKELYKMVKYDVDNEIEVYPKTLAKYLVNILKIIGDMND